MSTYYNAYLAKRTNEGIYEIIGPCITDNMGDKSLFPMWWRSHSFMHWDEWDTKNIPISKMGENTMRLCAVDFDDDKQYSIGYWISASDISKKASCEPIRGYLPVEEARMLIASGYNNEYISWEMESKPISAEFVAGLSDNERAKYSFVSYIDYESVEYQMWELNTILNGVESYHIINEGEELGVIFQVD